jgi:hypothetical protein
VLFERWPDYLKKVYLLQHSYEMEISDDLKTEETKVIGIYSSHENAAKAKDKLKTVKGFNRFSDDCFYIDEYELDLDHWTGGFVTWDSSIDGWIE